MGSEFCRIVAQPYLMETRDSAEAVNGTSMRHAVRAHLDQAAEPSLTMKRGPPMTPSTPIVFVVDDDRLGAQRARVADRLRRLAAR